VRTTASAGRSRGRRAYEALPWTCEREAAARGSLSETGLRWAGAAEATRGVHSPRVLSRASPLSAAPLGPGGGSNYAESVTEPISIACSLPPVERDDRREAWAAVAKRAVARERTEHALRLEFREPPNFEAELARLVQQEKECCPFLHFRIDAGAKALALAVTAPPEARPIVEELLQPADPRT
jgi:hypothetical protein